MKQLEKITIELWNHGLADNPTVPCGEISISAIKGEYIIPDFIEYLFDDENQEDISTVFHEYPTESWVKVEIQPMIEDGDWWFHVLSFKYLQEGESI